MISVKGRMINAMLRKRHLLQGKLKKERFDLNTSIPDFRAQCERGAARFGKLPDGVVVEREEITGIQAEWVKPVGAPGDKLIFYVHGGGYVSGSLNDHRGVVAKIAQATGFTCLHFEYRLAPEFPFPHGLNDSLSVWQGVVQKGYAPENIVMMGESAGGGLALAMLLAMKERWLVLPRAAVVISPWTDLTCSGNSYQTKNKVSLAPLDSWTVFAHHYIGHNEARNPLISPLFGTLSGFPPVLINAGESDELFDDSLAFYLKAKEAGVKVRFIKGEEMVHCYPLLAPLFPEATEAMNEIVSYIKYHLIGSRSMASM